MAADTNIVYSKENRLEKASFRAVEDKLEPWRITWVDTRDDVGRDGFVQLAEVQSEQVRVMPQVCGIQVKACEDPLHDVATVSVETRHLALWANEQTAPLLIARWSRATLEMRIRTARDLVLEADIDSPSWRQQTTVTIRFRREHSVPDPLTVTQIQRKVLDEYDARGGLNKFHKSIRRVLLSYLFVDGVTTEETISIYNDKRNARQRILVGPAWQSDDLSRSDIDAGRVLVGNLLLFEQLWMRLESLPSLLKLVGVDTVSRLVAAERIVFYRSSQQLAIIDTDGEIAGDMGMARLQDGSDAEQAVAFATALEKKTQHKGLAAIVRPSIRLVADSAAERALAETRRDIRNSMLRQELGLYPSPSSPDEFPIWDREIYARLLHQNLCAMIASEHALDVVDMEAAQSRVAAAKLSVSSFVRNIDTLGDVDRALAAYQLPDLGCIQHAIGIRQSVELALSTPAQEFRDWYWLEAAPYWNGHEVFRHQFNESARRILGLSLPVLKLLEMIRVAYLANIAGSVAVLSTPSPMPSGYGGVTRRVQNGAQTLAKQQQNQRRRRAARIKALLSQWPSPYEPCPCRSGAKFRFCCGQ